MKKEAQAPCPPPAGSAVPLRAEDLDQLYRREGPRLRHWLRGQGVPLDDLDEVVQESFRRLLGITGCSVGYLRAYLYRTAKNVWTNCCRSRSLHARKLVAVAFDESQSVPSPEHAVINQELLEVLVDVIGKLPPRQRMVFEWSLEKVPLEEIVARLASKGVKATVRTVQRDIVKVVTLCRQLTASQETKQERRE